MIYLIIDGGCGNQFFQYAFARAMQEKTGEKIIIDFSRTENAPWLWKNGGNSLQYFNTKYETGKADGIIQYKILRCLSFIGRICKFKNYSKRRYIYLLLCTKLFNRFGIYYFDACYYEFSISKTKNKVIRGFFESPKYFKEIKNELRKEFTPRYEVLKENKTVYENILKSESVCVSIKRMCIEDPALKDVYDYSMDYFYNAVKYIKSRIENIKLFIFSDDIRWCKENLKFEEEMIFEREDNPIWEKMRLMSSCKYFVIHNSTFSWWAQYLSTYSEKIVVAPSKWLQRNDQPIDIYEDDWIYMTNEGKILKEHE